MERRMPQQVVIAQGDTISHPYVVATQPSQWRQLVNIALADLNLPGGSARRHHRVSLHVQGPGYRIGEPVLVRRWMEFGYSAGYGGALFVDETTAEGMDWAWLARSPKPADNDRPVVYYDRASETKFPPSTVMPVDELRSIALEWVGTGRRPNSVGWLPVNSFRWSLDGAADLVQPD
jgi:hypothetical protein